MPKTEDLVVNGPKFVTNPNLAKLNTPERLGIDGGSRSLSRRPGLRLFLVHEFFVMFVYSRTKTLAYLWWRDLALHTSF